LHDVFGADALVAPLPGPAPLPARSLPVVVAVEEAIPPSSNGPPALRPGDLASVLDKLR
jgi:hypothetical protein